MCLWETQKSQHFICSLLPGVRAARPLTFPLGRTVMKQLRTALEEITLLVESGWVARKTQEPRAPLLGKWQRLRWGQIPGTGHGLPSDKSAFLDSCSSSQPRWADSFMLCFCAISRTMFSSSSSSIRFLSVSRS